MNGEVEAQNIDVYDTFKFADPYLLLGDIDKNKVIELFGLISRVEYTVMVLGYIDKRAGQRMKVDWIKFAESMSGKLLSLGSDKINNSVNYLRIEPPLQYMNSCNWEERSYKSGLSVDSYAILAAKDVRNNLFHGIKLNNPDHLRNNELIEAAIIVLKGCLIANDELNAYYVM